MRRSRRTRLTLCAVLGTAFVAAFAGSASAGEAKAAEKPAKVAARKCIDEERQVPGQGLSCRVSKGLWKVRLRDGSAVLTHGADASGSTVLAAVPRNPVCPTANPAGDYYQVAIVAWPSDVVPTETDASLRARIQAINGSLYEEAVESGSPNGADYVFACDGVGQIRVDRVALPRPASQTTFSTILSDLRAKGYEKTNEKYVVWYDASASYCGQGTIYEDETDAGTNPNNQGPDYGVSYDCNALMHEHGHNVGAVQYSSPFSSGSGGHCWQESDVMCYADGGDRAQPLVFTCTDRQHYDCKHDDYFDAKIGAGEGGGAGSYLDTSWNIGECYVRWIVNYACSSSPPETTIHSGPAGIVQSRVASFAFSASETGVSFECKLDLGVAGPCSSPQTYSNLAFGQHTVSIRARNSGGVVDPTPATRTWSVTPARQGGSLSCSASSPRMSVAAPIAQGLEPSGYVVTRTDFYRSDGTSSTLVYSAPWLVGVAAGGATVPTWYDYATGAVSGVQLSEAPGGSYWFALQLVVWYDLAGQPVTADYTPASAGGGTQTSGGLPFCYWPS